MLMPPATVELSGSIIGDVSGTIDTLAAKFAGADILSISCAKLVRVDFAAAGTLLNWVSTLHSQGRQVQFNGVHRLIAGFFNVVGISELARIVVRND
jgi:ABC-type transporter Mla MlaB component